MEINGHKTLAIPDGGGRIVWANYIRSLEARGWSKVGIARVADVSVALVSDLVTGRVNEPAYSRGVRLLWLQSREPVPDRRFK